MRAATTPSRDPDLIRPMDQRRFIFAIALITAIIILPSLLMRPPAPVPGADSVAVGGDTLATRVQQPSPALPAPADTAPADTARALTAVPEDTVVVSGELFRYAFSTRGATMVSATLPQYAKTIPGHKEEPVDLVQPGQPLFGLRLVVGSDTLSLTDWQFTPSSSEVSAHAEPAVLQMVAERGGVRVSLGYRFRADNYRMEVDGKVDGLGPNGALLLVGLGQGIPNTEADSAVNFRDMGLVTSRGGTELLRFQSLDPGEQRALPGPFDWVAVKSKYFVTALLALDSARARISGATARATGSAEGEPHQAEVRVALPLAAEGSFGWSVYAGPMEYSRLTAVGADFDDVNPYGWPGFRTLIRAFAVPVRWLIVWMHQALGLGYGLVLIALGVLVRLVLWPLNQKAMRSAMAMQAIQVPLKEIQARHKDNPAKLQQEMMKLYKEHNVNPLGGCVPMLIPMPVLFALFFVLQNTIELRGVPFLWFPDLAQPDPIYVIPVLSGLSMFGLSKVGQMGVEYTPETRAQAKMMLYFMPALITFFGLQFAAGLNLYWFASNVASIPQQWMIAKERMKRQPAKAAPAPAAAKPAATGRK
ncbi:MAG: membrane protein insertase YidC [Gemmatimonadales bacterium]